MVIEVHFVLVPSLTPQVELMSAVLAPCGSAAQAMEPAMQQVPSVHAAANTAAARFHGIVLNAYSLSSLRYRIVYIVIVVVKS